jgi:penicillin-binding protein 1A
LRDEDMIGEAELADATNTPATRAASFWTGSENYVADRVMGELPTLIGDVRSDIVVETTIDLTLQQLAEKSIRRLVDENGKKLNVSQGALVSIDNTGAVRAMVGGYDYADSQFDRASEARRQPGSAFKPFVFLAALEQGARPDSIRKDAPIKIGKWSPVNYNGKYYGDVTLATALAKSLNSVAAQLVMEVGAGSVVEAAQRVGIESELQANNAIALGTSEVTPLELTAAYVPFANGGFRPEVHFVKRVTTPQGEVLYEDKSAQMPRVISPEIVGMMNVMMSETLSDGTATKARFHWPAAGKTGTSQKSRDAWFVGYTANLTTGVWFGNDDGAPMKKVTGGALPALAWHEFMTAAHEGVPVAPLPGKWQPSTPDLFDEGVPDAAVAEQVWPEPDAGATKGGPIADAVAEWLSPEAGSPDVEPMPAASRASEAPPMPTARPREVRPAPVETSRRAAERPARAIAPQGDRPELVDADDSTASLRRPVPRAEVGGPPTRRETSILDVIFGNGG